MTGSPRRFEILHRENLRFVFHKQLLNAIRLFNTSPTTDTDDSLLKERSLQEHMTVTSLLKEQNAPASGRIDGAAAKYPS